MSGANRSTGSDVGKRYTRLLVLEDNETGSLRQCLCKCDCGAVKMVPRRHLRSASVRSCGCLREELQGSHSRTHGHAPQGSPSRIYRVFRAMHSRCSNPNQRAYPNYGGRGITVCERWSGKQGFENFAADMGEPPTGKTLERLKNHLGYEPSNCEWRTPTEQARNRRSSRVIEWNGQKKTLAEWCESLAIPYTMVHQRLKRKWTFERAVTEPRKR